MSNSLAFKDTFLCLIKYGIDSQTLSLSNWTIYKMQFRYKKF
jgi:hypothetical protein